MKPVKWGILSTANIGVAKVIPGMLKSKNLEVVAISSRNLKRAREAAMELGIAKSYGSYEEMLADPEIEALDYVNLQAPGQPSYGGEGHLLPPLP